MLSDLRYAFRQLAKSPGFTVLAVVTLGLGVGANTAMFSVLNRLLLKPLPYADSEQLDAIYRSTPQNPEGSISPADFSDLQKQMGSYGEVAAYAYADASLSEPGLPAEMPRSIRVTANLLSTLKTQPQLGRDFRAEENLRGNDRVLIISQRFWLNHFGGRADVIGRTVRINGEPHEIVGVLPLSFDDWRHLGWADVLLPLGLDKDQSADRHSTFLRVIGRHSHSLSRVQADSFIANFGQRIASDFPADNAGSTWRMVPLKAAFLGKSGPTSFAMLIGLSGLVLLIACSNLANLILARAMSHAHEFAVRSALGASRLRLLLPLINESVLLALAGGVCAVIIALWTTDWLNIRYVRSTGVIGASAPLGIDWHVLAWALAASLLTALAFSLGPALFAMRLNVNTTLKSGARGMTGSRGQQRFRQFLVVGQFALAMVLLAGAALFGQGLSNLNYNRSGWESAHLVSGTIILPTAGYPDADRINAFHRLAVERLEALPGVACASISSFTPFFNWYDIRKYIVEGRELPERGHEPAALINNITPRYFETVGTRLLAGRVFNEHDTLSTPKVYIISQATATGLFGQENPIGRRLCEVGSAGDRWGEIVGVVADVKSIVPDPGPVTFQLYQPMAQEPRARNEIEVRTVGAASSAPIDSIRTTMMDLDPDLPVRRLQSADASIDFANYQWVTLSDMLFSFAVLGLGLASLGIYGVIARTMAQRTCEFAIRLALGASVGDIVRIVLTSGIKLTLLGSGIGLIGAVGFFHLLSAGFPGMRIDSPSALISATLLLIAVALLACWLPARRATKVDPIVALRSE